MTSPLLPLPAPDIRVDAFGEVFPTNGRRFVMGDFFSAEQVTAYVAASRPAPIEGVVPEDGLDGGHIADRIERWFVEGLYAADASKCPYTEATIAERWWRRGCNATLRNNHVAELEKQCVEDERLMQQALAQLEHSQAGLQWYADMVPQFADESDEETFQANDAAIDVLRARLQPTKDAA
ncbi:MAG: hypothetical protein H7255_08840 [Ramlibacter sp.]|nr:hypothetical protein [Ramlibacter sp.]